MARCVHGRKLRFGCFECAAQAEPSRSSHPAPEVIVCMPSRGEISGETHAALSENMDGIRHEVLSVRGLPVERARNELSRLALLSGAPLVLWCDDDAWWPKGTLRRMLDAVKRNERIDVLSGYYGGRDHYSPPFAWRVWNDTGSIVDSGRNCERGAVVPVAACGMHFVLMRRHVLERTGPQPFALHSSEWTEDFSFYARAMSCRLGVFVDTGAVIAHVDDVGGAHTVGMPAGRIVGNRLELPPQPWPRPAGPRKVQGQRAYGLPGYGA